MPLSPSFLLSPYRNSRKVYIGTHYTDVRGATRGRAASLRERLREPMMSWGMWLWMLFGVLVLVGAVVALVLGVTWLVGRLSGPN